MSSLRTDTNPRHGRVLRRRSGPEDGQTILLVAISIVSLLMMAALAIDVVSLYTAKSEIQRAADAAAIAGAKAIADSGITTIPSGDANQTQAQLLATSMASAAIAAILPMNLVAGQAPTCTNCPPAIDWTRPGNPIITVTLQRTNLPTFFARVFGQRTASTGATAVAEAYNPANQQNFTPIQTMCVKPLLVGNEDPGNLGKGFVDPTTGTVVNGSAVIGETFALGADCPPASAKCSPPPNAPYPKVTTSPPMVQYVPAGVNSNNGDVFTTSTKPPCGSWPDQPPILFGSAMAGCSISTYQCGTNKAFFDTSVNPIAGGANSDVSLGAECLINASQTGPGQGQDTLTLPYQPYTSGPAQIIAGSSNPMSGFNVTNSSSIVTIPIINSPPDSIPTGGGLMTVVGFLQVFIQDVNVTNPTNLDVTVLNVVGCSNTPNANPTVVGGNGTSVIPVRLITPSP